MESANVGIIILEKSAVNTVRKMKHALEMGHVRPREPAYVIQVLQGVSVKHR
jgi:hypothetical protein